jgi:hypothetical protein
MANDVKPTAEFLSELSQGRRTEALVELRRPPPPKAGEVPAALDPAQIAAANVEEQKTALDQVREAAGKWAGTISALISISSIVTVLTARDTISKLDPWWQWAIGTLLVAALLCAAGAVFLAVRAEVGDLKIFDKPSPPNEELATRLARHVDNEPADAARAIRGSQALAALAFLLFISGIVVTWVGTAKAPAPAYLVTKAAPTPLPGASVTATAGPVICGRLTTDAGNGQSSLITKSGTLVPVTDPSSLKAVDSCHE